MAEHGIEPADLTESGLAQNALLVAATIGRDDLRRKASGSGLACTMPSSLFGLVRVV
jgi:hypothetical protein